MWKKLCLLFVVFHFHSSVDAFLDGQSSKISIRHFLETKKQSKVSSVNDEECDKQLALFDDAFVNREPWAVKLFDLWGKINSGYLEGNRFSLGHYTECLDFLEPIQQNIKMQGQYCLVVAVPIPNSTITEQPDGFDWREIGVLARNQSLSFMNGVCLPASCSPQKSVQFVNSKFLSKADLVGLSANCQTGDPKQFEILDYFTIVIFSAFALLLVCSTTYDVLMRQQDKEPNKLLIAFSVYTNGKILFDVTRSKSPNSINCLLGLRGISIVWIIFGHRLKNAQNFPFTNPRAVLEFYNHVYSSILSVYNIAVDTFFLMGALLLTISTMNALDKKKLNYPRMVLHRYLRYTPVLAAIILVIVFTNKFYSQGPIVMPRYNDNCIRYWWSALLHIQNYVNPNQMCAFHSWYLSADFQLFVISPFVFIYPAWRWRQKFIWTLPVLAILSSISTLVVCLTQDLRVFMQSQEKIVIYYQWIYIPTHAKMGPWLVGIVLGYILFNAKGKLIKISKSMNAFLWVLSLSTLVAIVVLIQPLRQPLNNQTSLVANAVYIAFHRLLWSIAVSWIIFACQILKTGGIINWFLSLPEWQPIGRMSLSIYLVQLVYQITSMLNLKQATTFEIWNMMHVYWGDILVALALGTVFYLTFETPFLLIENYVYNKLNKIN